jgi:hypothetical protein
MLHTDEIAIVGEFVGGGDELEAAAEQANQLLGEYVRSMVEAGVEHGCGLRARRPQLGGKVHRFIRNILAGGANIVAPAGTER